MAYTDIDDPTANFNTILWTGDGNSSRSITGVGFAPDMIWWKGRDTTFDHRLIDTLRSGTYPDLLYPNATTAESEDANNAEAIGSDGFTVGSGNAVNQNTKTYVAWNWKAGGSGSANTDGTITSTVSANTTAGFSVGTYTANATAGATVGHGLGVAPDMLIVKVRNNTNNWAVYHESVGATKALYLDSTSGETTDGWMNNTAPSSSVFTLSGGNYGNASGYEVVFYAFAEKQGFSKFGSYTGNGSSNGPYIHTGFLPAFVMIKRTDTTSDWNIMDNKRAVSFNPNTKELYANSNQAEATGGQTIRDYLSNGFKLRGTSGGTNASGGTYIFMAFAESPFANSNGTPNNAE